MVPVKGGVVRLLSEATEHGTRIAERDVDQFEAGEPEADGAFAGDPRVDDLADGLDVDLQQTGCSAVPWGLSSLSRSRSRSGRPMVVGRPFVAVLVSTRASLRIVGPLVDAVDAGRTPVLRAELTLAEGQRSRQRDVLVMKVEHRLPDHDPPP